MAIIKKGDKKTDANPLEALYAQLALQKDLVDQQIEANKSYAQTSTTLAEWIIDNSIPEDIRKDFFSITGKDSVLANLNHYEKFIAERFGELIILARNVYNQIYYFNKPFDLLNERELEFKKWIRDLNTLMLIKFRTSRALNGSTQYLLATRQSTVEIRTPVVEQQTQQKPSLLRRLFGLQ